MSVFNAYSEYYDQIYWDKDYEAETRYVDLCLKIAGIQSGNSILEYGSGTGKHGKLLALMGYKVVGIEKSQAMVEKSLGAPIEGFQAVCGDIVSLKVPQKFDAVISLFHVLSYINSSDDIDRVFSNAADNLNHGGIFMFDFWYSPSVLKIRPSIKIKRLESKSSKIVRIAEPEIIDSENRVNVKYTIYIENLQDKKIHKITEIHSMRHFSLPELDYFAKNNKFERVFAEEFLSGRSPDLADWAVNVMYKKTR